jgi:hypothetical protein
MGFTTAFRATTERWDYAGVLYLTTNTEVEEVVIDVGYSSGYAIELPSVADVGVMWTMYIKDPGGLNTEYKISQNPADPLQYFNGEPNEYIVTTPYLAIILTYQGNNLWQVIEVPGTPSNFLYTNTAFVHPAGDNSSAVIGDFYRPFATIYAAANALMAVGNHSLTVHVMSSKSGRQKDFPDALPAGVAYSAGNVYWETQQIVIPTGTRLNIHLEAGVQIVYKSPFNPPYWTNNKENAWIVIGDTSESTTDTALIITSDASTNSINVFCDLIDPTKPVPVCAIFMNIRTILDASNVMFYGDIFSVGGDYGVIRSFGIPKFIRLRNVQIIATDKSDAEYGNAQPNTAACISIIGVAASDNYTEKNGQIFLHDCKLYYKSFLEVSEGEIFPDQKHRSCIYVESYLWPLTETPAWTNIFASSTYFSVSTIGEYAEGDADYAKWHAIHIQTNTNVDLGIDAGVTVTFSGCTYFCNTESRIGTVGIKQPGFAFFSTSLDYNIGIAHYPNSTYHNWEKLNTPNYTGQGGESSNMLQQSIYTFPFYCSVS